MRKDSPMYRRIKLFAKIVGAVIVAAAIQGTAAAVVTHTSLTRENLNWLILIMMTLIIAALFLRPAVAAGCSLLLFAGSVWLKLEGPGNNLTQELYSSGIDYYDTLTAVMVVWLITFGVTAANPIKRLIERLSKRPISEVPLIRMGAGILAVVLLLIPFGLALNVPAFRSFMEGLGGNTDLNPSALIAGAVGLVAGALFPKRARYSARDLGVALLVYAAIAVALDIALMGFIAACVGLAGAFGMVTVLRAHRVSR
jgi:hypothetical protein